eukprot:1202418-Rhodomonas_salina.1
MPGEIITPAAALAIKTGATKSVLKVGSKRARTEEIDDDATTAEALAAEISAEQRALAEKQHALALITTGTAAQGYTQRGGRGGCGGRGQGSGRGGRSGRGGGRGGGAAAGSASQNTRSCKICCKTHAGDPPEK